MTARNGLLVRRVDPHPSALPYEREQSMRFEFDEQIEQSYAEEEALYRDLRPERKKPVVCLHWLRGLCHKNEYTCDCYHVYDERMLPICQFFIRGGCTNGDCMFRHPTNESDDVFCIAYARGFCPRGDSCTERHVQRTARDREHIGQYVREAIESHRRAEQRARKYTTLRVDAEEEPIVFTAYQKQKADFSTSASRKRTRRLSEQHSSSSSSSNSRQTGPQAQNTEHRTQHVTRQCRMPQKRRLRRRHQ